MQFVSSAEHELEVSEERVDLPDDHFLWHSPDVVKNIAAEAEETKISYVASTPKPRLNKLSLKSEGTESFHSAGRINHAHRL